MEVRQPARGADGVKVSVIIPVYNTGEEDLSRCAESVLAQSMDDYEVIFADDGSSDGTEKLLDEIEAEHERVRVLHLPPSGGPGGPRNEGIEIARGEYVYFLDDDDWLAEEALERMYAMAVRNDSDIVIGKMVGHGRVVPKLMFRRNRDRADILQDTLYGILTPHKLFRRDFLNEHRIRFPEGPVRLEDHQFVVRAYFCADTISVLADYACCHWMKRHGSYSRKRPEPVHYHDALGKVLDIVDEYVEPGPLRDRHYLSWYRKKTLNRFGERGFLEAGPEYRRAFYDEARRFALERYGPGVEDCLPVRMRVRSRLLRDGAYDEMFQLVEAEQGVGLDAVLDGVRWHGDRLAVRFTARFVYRDGTPVRIEDERWRPPAPAGVPDELLRVDDRPWRFDLYVRRRSDSADFLVPTTGTLLPDGAMSGEGLIDAAAIPGLTNGTWDVIGRMDGGGWVHERRLRGYTRDLPARGRLEPYRTVNGNLSLRVRTGPSAKSTLRRMAARLRRG